MGEFRYFQMAESFRVYTAVTVLYFSYFSVISMQSLVFLVNIWFPTKEGKEAPATSADFQWGLKILPWKFTHSNTLCFPATFQWFWREWKWEPLHLSVKSITCFGKRALRTGLSVITLGGMYGSLAASGWFDDFACIRARCVGQGVWREEGEICSPLAFISAAVRRHKSGCWCPGLSQWFRLLTSMFS